MAARDDAQCTCFAGHGVEVEGDLDAGQTLVAVAIGMPMRVSHVQVTVTARIVKVLA